MDGFGYSQRVNSSLPSFRRVFGAFAPISFEAIYPRQLEETTRKPRLDDYNQQLPFTHNNYYSTSSANALWNLNLESVQEPVNIEYPKIILPGHQALCQTTWVYNQGIPAQIHFNSPTQDYNPNWLLHSPQRNTNYPILNNVAYYSTEVPPPTRKNADIYTDPESPIGDIKRSIMDEINQSLQKTEYGELVELSDEDIMSVLSPTSSILTEPNENVQNEEDIDETTTSEEANETYLAPEVMEYLLKDLHDTDAKELFFKSITDFCKEQAELESDQTPEKPAYTKQNKSHPYREHASPYSVPNKPKTYSNRNNKFCKTSQKHEDEGNGTASSNPNKDADSEKEIFTYSKTDISHGDVRKLLSSTIKSPDSLLRVSYYSSQARKVAFLHTMMHNKSRSVSQCTNLYSLLKKPSPRASFDPTGSSKTTKTEPNNPKSKVNGAQNKAHFPKTSDI